MVICSLNINNNISYLLEHYPSVLQSVVRLAMVWVHGLELQSGAALVLL